MLSSAAALLIYFCKKKEEMKAIVMFQKVGMPEYVENFPEPQVNGEDQVIITVLAAAIKHLDKSKASGTHYSTQADFDTAKVLGMDGVGVLENGDRVFAIGMTGMLAEKAVVEKSRMIPVPDGLDVSIAAALPNAIGGSLMALRFRANIKPGDTVLINGATGVTGRMAVQVARYYGAGRIIGTGRNEESLKYLLASGVDEVISLQQDDEEITKRLQEVHRLTPIDIVLDYIWGHSATLILGSFKGQGNFTHQTRFVSIGSLGGDTIQLSSEVLRSVDLHLTGSGMGSWTKSQMQMLLSEIIPEMFQLAADGKLKMDVQTASIAEIGKFWDLEVSDGKRLVALM